MFLVEPKSGERCHYGSARALGAAIRRGELGPEARIYHQAANRWLSITVHPEYRLAEFARQVSNAPHYERQWTFLAERPDAAPDALFGPIPSPGKTPCVLMIPGKPAPSWLEVAFRRVVSLARSGT